MTPMRIGTEYHPFLHEVAAAEPDPTLGAAVHVEAEAWPGLWFGDLAFARAGVRVRCGPEAPVDAGLAASTTLYSVWTRAHRPAFDLSHGWGSHSQWATAFRRDYADGAVLRYNVDGERALTGEDGATAMDPGRVEAGDGPGADDDLTRAERIELLTHRCFVRTRKPDRGRWPFHDTFVAPAPGPDWIR